MKKSLLILTAVGLWIWSAAATADDKDLLKATGSAPPNIMIVFGNSETTEQPIEGASSAWNGDADSPVSKMGAAKAVLKQWVSQNHTNFNIGMSAFTHGSSLNGVILAPNKGVVGKHWLYSPVTVDFPGDTFQEPIGTIERWGPNGEGPCTNLTIPACTDVSPNFITLPSTGGVEVDGNGLAHFFGAGPAVSPWFICLDGTKCNDGNKDDATKRIKVTLTTGSYGDAYTDGSLTALKISTAPAHSMEVTKEYQIKSGKSGTWQTQSQTPNLNPGTKTVFYAPALPGTADFFYTTGTDAGKEIGFLNDNPLARDFLISGNCSGWEFQSNNATLPLIRIPRDYNWSAPACLPPQNSQPCFNRLMRPQARLVSYNQGTGVFAPNDYDNPGYVPGVSEGNATSCPTCYNDGCDPDLLGAVDAGLNDIGRQAILQTQNSSQAPIKNLLNNAYNYFKNPAIDGFQDGSRTDDPNAACRRSAIILIYDTFNGCQGDPCDPSFIKTNETPFQTLGGNGGVPVFVIGFGASATASAASGVCIAHNTGTPRFMPDGSDGYFAVSDAAGLFLALDIIASLLNESPQTFSAAAVSATQAQGGQMAYFASFNPTSERSIWNGRLNGYRLDPTTGFIQVCQSLFANPPVPCADGLGQFTIKDPNDPHKGATIPFPSSASVLTNPSNPSLIWNAGLNLHDTPGTGATVSSAVLAPNATLAHGTYSDTSNDTTTTVPTNFYPGRKIVFSLPQGYTSPVTTLPIPAGTAVPETRHDMTCPDVTSGKCSNNTGVSWWPDLKAILGPQTSPPNVLSPALTDADAGDSLRFIWGDRDSVTGATNAIRQYFGLKLGDIFHSVPLLVGNPNDFPFFTANLQDYQSFFNAYRNRRRVLYVGANDGLLHAFDAGAVGRDSTVPNGYDLGTGAELFAFAPRAIMQIYKPLKDSVGPQTKTDEWTVDLSPSAADAFIDTNFSTTPNPVNRAWHTVLVSGMREGSPFEGTSGTSPKDSLGSYFALDVTQPDELVGSPAAESPGTFNAPKCLNKSGDASCARDWPTVLWEIADTTDLDVSGSPGAGYFDMGETWSKPAMGRVKVCTGGCGNPGATTEDHYVAIFGGGFDRERKNRRGNWLYIVDIETGMTLYKVNSNCGGDPVISGCAPTYFGSMPSGPTALDFDGDGYLDLIYIGDMKGQLWRIDLRDLRKLNPAPGGRFRNQLDLAAGSGAPFLFFQAGPASLPSTCAPNCFYSMYHRPDTINLGYNVGGRPALGIAFGTGDRDDIRATIDPASLTYPQRFYYVVDAANATTRRESDLTDISSPTAPAITSVSASGWMLELINGERVVGDTLSVGGIIRFPTFNPPPLTPVGSIPPCNNVNKCGSLSAGVSRLYSVFYTNGNAYPVGSTDRGQTQTNATFITGVTGYIGGTGGASGLYWSGGVQNPNLGVGKKITVRSWKEKTSQP